MAINAQISQYHTFIINAMAEQEYHGKMAMRHSAIITKGRHIITSCKHNYIENGISMHAEVSAIKNAIENLSYTVGQKDFHWFLSKGRCLL